MISSEVQRTLVKSPPELWAELSDPAALARHLGELGEIRITKVKPEQSVEWEAEAAKGKVELKPSGWGTKVTLSVVQELPDSTPGDASSTPPEAEQPIEQTEAIDLQGEVPEPEEPIEAAEAMEQVPAPKPEQPAKEPAEVDSPQPVAMDVEEVAPEERPGFFARLFRRKGKAAKNRPEPEQPTVPEPEQITVLEPEQPAVSEQGTLAEDAAAPNEGVLAPDASAPEARIAADDANASAETPPPEETPQDEAPSDDLAAEPAVAEEALAAQTTELLTTVLDRLGAAHHRPFSRG